MTHDPARRVGVAGEPAVPDVHAAVARRRGVLRADRDQGRRARTCCRKFDPAEVLRDHRGAEDHRDDAGAVDALRADGPPGLAHPRPVVAGDRVLRRLGDQPGAAAGGDRPVRPDLRAVLRPVRGADGDHLPGQGRPRREAADVVRAADAVRPDGAARTRTASRCRRARSARSACPARCCRGGYWKLPDATAETFRDGWMHTGDVAREDEDGFWYIVDRTKDMIVTGGFNVFPREVEDVVAEHPAIAQVVRDRHAGREVGRGGHRGRRAASATRRPTRRRRRR